MIDVASGIAVADSSEALASAPIDDSALTDMLTNMLPAERVSLSVQMLVAVSPWVDVRCLCSHTLPVTASVLLATELRLVELPRIVRQLLHITSCFRQNPKTLCIVCSHQ